LYLCEPHYIASDTMIEA